jgi:hypothetical protein
MPSDRCAGSRDPVMAHGPAPPRDASCGVGCRAPGLRPASSAG